MKISAARPLDRTPPLSTPSAFCRPSPATLTRWIAFTLLFASIALRDSSELEPDRIQQAAAPYAFNLLDWEAQAIGARLSGLAAALSGALPAADVGGDMAAARSYFLAPAGARPALRSEAEAAIERLVSDAWRAEGLARPSMLAGGRQVLFPPVAFTFAEPPRVLIVSPRERIEVRQYVLLRSALDPPSTEFLETGVAGLGVSTLVASTGGLTTYPSMVLAATSAQATLATVAHEWVHAYFFFNPLGRGYWSNQELRTINETAAELAGNELGQRLTVQIGLPAEPAPASLSPRQTEFSSLMRETRREVDRMLGLGLVDESERYMERQRLELNTRGFGVRRLNQAYFAFYGSYGDSPAASSPAVARVRQLRSHSASLGEFLRVIAQVGSPGDLGTRWQQGRLDSFF